MGDAWGPAEAGGERRDSATGRFVADLRPSSIVRKFVDNSGVCCKKRVAKIPDVGDRFGNITVTGYEVGPKGGIKKVMVKCNCGGLEYGVDFWNLRSGRSLSCQGCRIKTTVASVRSRGYADIIQDDDIRTRLLNRLSAAVSRCHNPKDANWHSYGGRGITVAKHWRENRRLFLEFVQHLDGWDNPDLEMDRINNNKGYEPFNIQFSSRKANAANKRKVKDMQKEIDDLRSRLRGAEEEIHRLNGGRTDHSS